MNDFADIEIPNKGGAYMKFNQPENLFRILSKPIVGYEGWKTQPDGSRKPVRKHVDEQLTMTDFDNDGEEVKYFWAMKVFNYQTEQIEILEITQKTIQKAIKSIASDKDFGSPFGYDIKVSKTGEGKETRYTVIAKPPKALGEDIKQLDHDTPVNLNALFKGDNPFKSEEVNVDEIPEFEGMKEELDKATNIRK